MKAFILFSFVATLLMGCSRQESMAADSASGSGAAQGEAAAPQARAVTVEALDTMKFTETRIEAAPGETLAITLKNIGKLPKEAMGHNLVLLKKGADPQAYATAAAGARANDYLPPALADQVIAATKLLGPGESDTVTFTVPAEPGEYVYLCSFPGHFFAGMKGVVVVK